MERKPEQHANAGNGSALDGYVSTTEYLLEGVIAEHGPAFAAYLDSIDPQDTVNEITTDFLHRYHSSHTSEIEAIESLLDNASQAKHSPDELWEHLTAIYEITHGADGRIHLFNPTTTGGHHGTV